MSISFRHLFGFEGAINTGLVASVGHLSALNQLDLSSRHDDESSLDDKRSLSALGATGTIAIWRHLVRVTDMD